LRVTVAGDVPKWSKPLLNLGQKPASAAEGAKKVVATGLAMLLATALAAPASAQPLFQRGALCRDGKGLAKPCAPGEGTRQDKAPAAARPVAHGGQDEAGTLTAATGDGAAKPAKRPLFQRGTLCRDSKGLAKPCS
jgi:hypothetical protein